MLGYRFLAGLLHCAFFSSSSELFLWGFFRGLDLFRSVDFPGGCWFFWGIFLGGCWWRWYWRGLFGCGWRWCWRVSWVTGEGVGEMFLVTGEYGAATVSLGAGMLGFIGWNLRFLWGWPLFPFFEWLESTRSLYLTSCPTQKLWLWLPSDSFGGCVLSEPLGLSGGKLSTAGQSACNSSCATPWLLQSLSFVFPGSK